MIRANSKAVTVVDGTHFRKGYWYIMPEVRPDYYPVENPKKPHRVSFYTDLDSISFGLDNKTYLKARVNKGKPMSFQFDLGATHFVVDESITAETGIQWEGSAAMGSVQGTEQVRSSKYNTIKVGETKASLATPSCRSRSWNSTMT